jgi:hypothetical protein
MREQQLPGYKQRMQELEQGKQAAAVVCVVAIQLHALAQQCTVKSAVPDTAAVIT